MEDGGGASRVLHVPCSRLLRRLRGVRARDGTAQRIRVGVWSELQHKDVCDVMGTGDDVYDTGRSS